MLFDTDITALAVYNKDYCVGLVSGHVYAYRDNKKIWSTKRHKSACRGVSYSPDGTKIVTIGADNVVKVADSTTGRVIDKYTHPDMTAVCALNDKFYTGNDAGVLKEWPSGKIIFTHDDYISSITIRDESILATSGDGTVSLHSKSTKSIQSDDQEDDLTCLITMRKKVLVGGTDGVILMFDEITDCNDRIPPPDRPMSVESLAKIDDSSCVVGASDGARLLTLFPHKYTRMIVRCDEPIVAFSNGIVYAASGRTLYIVPLEQPTTNFFDEL